MSVGGESQVVNDSGQGARAAEFQREQERILKQQEVEKQQRTKQLERDRINALRGRFGMGGGVGADTGVADSSLYSRITGR